MLGLQLYSLPAVSVSCSCFQREVESLDPRQDALALPVPHSALAGTSYDKAWVSMRWLGHLFSALVFICH